MRSLLVETRVGGQYHEIISRVTHNNRSTNFLFNDNCLALDVTEIAVPVFVIVFPLDYDFLVNSEREMRGYQGYMNLISIFFKKKFQSQGLKFERADLVSAKYKIKNKKVFHIGLKFIDCNLSLTDDDFEKQNEQFEKFFQTFSINFKTNINLLKRHISSKNPNRYKLIR